MCFRRLLSRCSSKSYSQLFLPVHRVGYASIDTQPSLSGQRDGSSTTSNSVSSANNRELAPQSLLHRALLKQEQKLLHSEATMCGTPTQAGADGVDHGRKRYIIVTLASQSASTGGTPVPTGLLATTPGLCIMLGRFRACSRLATQPIEYLGPLPQRKESTAATSASTMLLVGQPRQERALMRQLRSPG